MQLYSKKITANTDDELLRELNELRARKIIEVERTTPDATDTNHWFKVYYAK